MAQCESCGAGALSDAQFCEACGHRLGTPSEASKKAAEAVSPGNPEATPGSLRANVAFLSGAVDQAKIRLADNWKQRGEKPSTKIEAERQAVQKREEQEERRASAKGPIARITRFVVGVSALLLFVYLLIRIPRGQMTPLMTLQLYKEMMKEFGIDQSF
jgi:hypothetical protein